MVMGLFFCDWSWVTYYMTSHVIFSLLVYWFSNYRVDLSVGIIRKNLSTRILIFCFRYGNAFNLFIITVRWRYATMFSRPFSVITHSFHSESILHINIRIIVTVNSKKIWLSNTKNFATFRNERAREQLYIAHIYHTFTCKRYSRMNVLSGKKIL